VAYLMAPFQVTTAKALLGDGTIKQAERERLKATALA
jgi:hypothetical protein